MISYELKQKTRIEELAADALVLEHKKTGARVFLLQCEDENKVFTIGFRTPPSDSTGVPHIIEHTVLCGSEKYPCKDPFIELAKGSLNTFLNAMTYPDKTVYPVASCNDRDFENLVDVYCDAVFHPNIYREPKIFRQEGWHYELDDDGNLIYNGVVYNEMKGAYSSPDTILERAIGQVLFRNHTYGTESGGDPDNIPELSYEEFLDFHRRYYHPSNSYIYIYGNADMEKMLEKLDREYLSQYDRLEIDSAIPEAAGWDQTREAVFDYSISDTEDENKSTILSIHELVGGELDPVKYAAFQILEDVLLDVPGAPVREALQQAGIGDDIGGGYAGGIRQPYFSVTARNCRPTEKEEFVRIVKETLHEQAQGLDHEALRASINVMEFRTREADFGSYPKGLIYGLNSFDSWLYDADPTLHLQFEKVFEKLKEKVDENYFEQLLTEALLENTSEAVIVLNPVKGLTKQKEEALAERLAALKESLSDEELETIVRETAELKAYQSEPSPEEDIRKIPLLSREDIGKKAAELPWVRKNICGHPVLHCNYFTSGIVYIKLLFNLKDLTPEEIPYAALLTEVLGYIDTQTHGYGELSTLINLNSGGIGFSTDSYVAKDSPTGAIFTFAANAKVLHDRVEDAFAIIDEILFTSKLQDTERIRDIIAEVRARQKDAILAAGHQTALNRAGAFLSDDRWFLDRTRGIAYYRMLEKADAENVSKKLQEICGRILRPENCLYHFVCDGDGYRECCRVLEKRPAIADDAAEEMRTAFAGIRRDPSAAGGRHEVFTSASLVNYVARFGNFRTKGYDYHGALIVLTGILNYNYLWNNVRVLGGAYGCSSVAGMSGAMGFSSYRDPNLCRTDETFRKAADFVRDYEADEREMTKAVIGAVSSMDMPLTPLTKGMRALSAYLSGVTQEIRQKNRDQVLQVQPSDIRALYPLLEAVMKDDYVCAIAGEASADECDESFVRESLYLEN